MPLEYIVTAVVGAAIGYGLRRLWPRIRAAAPLKISRTGILGPRCARDYANNIWHDIGPANGRRDREWERVIRAKGSILCPHASLRAFIRTDTTEGPGWMSDSYEGLACVYCGTIPTERKVY